MAILVGFGYKASSGKDTAADYLKNVHGWYKAEFAKNLKDCLCEVFGLSHYQLYSTGGKESRFSTPVIYDRRYHRAVLEWVCDSLCRPYGSLYDERLFDRIGTVLETPRALLQFVGTDIMRSLVANYHSLCCLSDIPPNRNVVISDVRFPDEGHAIIDKGGFCFEVKRDIVFLDNKFANHKSEEAMVGWRGWLSSIDNNSSFDNLYCQIEEKLLEIQHAK